MKTTIRIIGYLSIIGFLGKSDIVLMLSLVFFFGWIEALFFIQEGALEQSSAIFILSTMDLSKKDKNYVEALLELSCASKLEDSLYGQFFWYSIGSLNIFIYSDGERSVTYRFIEQGEKTGKEAFGEFLRSIK